MLVATWNETISKFWQEDGRTCTPIARQKRLCPRDLEPSPKWKCKQWKTTDHYFFLGGGGGGGGGFGGGKISTPAPPPQPRKKIMVRPLPFLICILYLYANFSTISHLLFLKWVQGVSEQPRPQGAFPPIKPGKSALGTRLVSER